MVCRGHNRSSNIDGTEYIWTDRDSSAEDNLENLPRF
ncbi:DUF3892 domain-containing protein [Methanobacterium sp. SMA-27]